MKLSQPKTATEKRNIKVTKVSGCWLYNRADIERYGVDVTETADTDKVYSVDGSIYVNVTGLAGINDDLCFVRVGDLLAPDTSNIKLAKSAEKFGDKYVSYILYLAPHSIGGLNVCPQASAGCISGCLYTSNNGRYAGTQVARTAKKLFYTFARSLFLQRLNTEISKAKRLTEGTEKTLCIRLNGTSDIGWFSLGIMEQYPTVRFYDYTKVARRFNQELPANYDLTFSRSENTANQEQCETILGSGFNVAAVFSEKLYPLVVAAGTYRGFPVIDGDSHDLRLSELDGRGNWVALKAKGSARSDDSGFVIREL